MFKNTLNKLVNFTVRYSLNILLPLACLFLIILITGTRSHIVFKFTKGLVDVWEHFYNRYLIIEAIHILIIILSIVFVIIWLFKFFYKVRDSIKTKSLDTFLKSFRFFSLFLIVGLSVIISLMNDFYYRSYHLNGCILISDESKPLPPVFHIMTLNVGDVTLRDIEYLLENVSYLIIISFFIKWAHKRLKLSCEKKKERLISYVHIFLLWTFMSLLFFGASYDLFPRTKYGLELVP